MQRHSTQQVNTRRHKMITKARGTMEFVKFGALTREVSVADLADGAFMSGGKTASVDVEASFYAADYVLAKKVEDWHRAFEAGAPTAYESSVHQYLRTNGTVGMRVRCERIAVTSVAYPEVDAEGDGTGGMITVTFRAFNPVRQDV